MLAPLAALLLAAPPPPAAATAPPTAAEGREFAARLNEDLRRLGTRAQTLEWIKETYITDDTERAAAWGSEEVMAYTSRAIHDSMRFAGSDLDPDTRRMLMLLRTSTDYPPAPSDPARRAELAALASRLGGMYGKGKWCGKDGKARCRALPDLEEVMKHGRRWDELLDAWAGWRTVSAPMRPLYERFVALSNEGAREIGFADLGEQWRAGYDMAPAEFAAETDRLWEQVRPLYEALHCYVRARLSRLYGRDRVPEGGLVPAHLLGNMWAQSWENLYPLVEPYPGEPSLDVEAGMRRRRWDPVRMVKAGEAFFTSLGLAPLPATFWERSMLTKPRDREVVCHASAWDVDYRSDLRIKMCIRMDGDDLVTVHHELGHNFYQRAYERQPLLFQAGANDGFHEALGDAIALSVTPAYLQRLGLVGSVPRGEKGTVDVQMRRALEKVAFLPFGLLVDRWRWDVFSGKVKPAGYDAAWWDLVARYQGLAPPVPRTEADFDPGAKMHVAFNVPYTRYFLSFILQFQLHRAMCRIAGWQGPLHACSVYGNREVGRRLEAMMAMGASRPWPDALEALTGERRLDASALLEYFAPLRSWLDRENAGRKCGW